MNKKIIVPQILKGTREFGPQVSARRSAVMQKMVEVFTRFGYAGIEMPILNPAGTILGKYGEEGDRLTYNWEDAGGRRIALPYDLTVPFARFVAANWRDLPMPFKRYQIQRVWRAERPQKGRLREFYQCDIDVIGTKSLFAEAEIAKVIVEVFRSIGLPDVLIKVNSRRLLDAVLEKFNVPKEKRTEAIRAIDKLDKMGRGKVIEVLRQKGIEKARELMQLLQPEEDNAQTFEKFKDYNIDELRAFFGYARSFGISEGNLQFDPSLARGLDYYTGLVFEVVGRETSPGLRPTPLSQGGDTFSKVPPLVRGGQRGGVSMGTLCAGGRYDDLCSLFSDRSFSGVGVAFGFERMMMALEEKGLLQDINLSTKVLVANFGEELMENALKIVNELTSAGINTELYFDPTKLEKQFKYADKKQVPFVVMCGPDELARGEVKIKIMETGKQKEIPQNQLVTYIQTAFSGECAA